MPQRAPQAYWLSDLLLCGILACPAGSALSLGCRFAVPWMVKVVGRWFSQPGQRWPHGPMMASADSANDDGVFPPCLLGGTDLGRPPPATLVVDREMGRRLARPWRDLEARGPALASQHGIDRRCGRGSLLARRPALASSTLPATPEPLAKATEAPANHARREDHDESQVEARPVSKAVKK